ncbi:MAG: glycosyltransferase family 2 protein [Brevibacterium aurantiacum]|nr:glycosyltransferase [Brevibacterium aurantiacum]
MTNGIRVSVVAPVYNAGPFLDAFVNSFLIQTLPAESIELIAVNDGSTDDSAAILDDFAREHQNVRVIHQENSGWPGKPRNVGLAAAQGDYVFFADPDDEFGGPEALKRLVDFADEHASDVVVPKMVPRGGRLYAQWRYETTQIDADLVTCFTTLTPQKLFRREFLVDQDIRFPEEKVRLEDGQFLSLAYLKANRVSILGGYDFYLIVHHDEQDHLSAKAVDPANYIGSVAVISENAEKNCADSDTCDRIINEVYSRKVLSSFTDSRLLRYSMSRRIQWLESQRKFVERFITPERYGKMNSITQARTDLVRNGNLDEIVKYARVEQADFSITSASSKRGVVELRGSLSRLSSNGQVPQLDIVERGNNTNVATLPIDLVERDAVIRVPKEALPLSESTRRYDLWLNFGANHKNRRVQGPSGGYSQQLTDSRTVEIYTTKPGNLSIAVSKGMRRRDRAERKVKRILGR